MSTVHKITKEDSEKKDKKRKGIVDILDIEHVDKAGEAALYYGFTPIKTPALSGDDLQKAKNVSQGEVIIDSDTHENGASSAF